MNNETKPLLEILGGFRVSSLGQVGLFLWMIQASQLNPNDLQPKTYFSLKSVSELKLISSGQSSAETGFLPIWLRLSGTPRAVPSEWLLWGTAPCLLALAATDQQKHELWPCV